MFVLRSSVCRFRSSSFSFFHSSHVGSPVGTSSSGEDLYLLPLPTNPHGTWTKLVVPWLRFSKRSLPAGLTTGLLVYFVFFSFFRAEEPGLKKQQLPVALLVQTTQINSSQYHRRIAPVGPTPAFLRKPRPVFRLAALRVPLPSHDRTCSNIIARRTFPTLRPRRPPHPSSTLPKRETLSVPIGEP